MNKTELVKAIAEKAGISQADAKKALDATTEVIVEAVKGGDSISLIGFGSFSVAERAERQGINPLTKEQITIAASKSLKFKASKGILD